MHIFVEGISDKIFLEMLCSYLNINAEYTATSGKDNLINTVKIKKYDNPIIIFDADNDFQNSVNNIKNQIEILDSTISPKIFLFPDNENTGNLETLLEDICIHTDIKDCFIKYKTCILFSPRDMLKIEELCEYSFSKNFYCTVLFAIFAKKRKRWKV